jgi:hypothetical protein
MAELITSDQNITATAKSKPGGSLVSYVVDLVRTGRDARDVKHKSKWDAFERTYRGIYEDTDRTREGERSRLIAPALTQAVDSIHAGMVDAVLGRDNWIDVSDEFEDQNKQDVERIRKNLIEDYAIANVPDAISKIILYGCIYGTGIGKINVKKVRVPSIQAQTQAGPIAQFDDRPLVMLEPVPPWEFVKDEQARDIDNGLFCAHETNIPKNVVWTKQVRGIYRKSASITGFNSSKIPYPAGESSVDENTKQGEWEGAVWVTEYYGLVPARLLRAEGVKFTSDDVQGNGMVECIVTVANESELLRVVANPFTMKDRPIVAYQHSHVPGRWWGEGVVGKGWNAQRALDAELRARMDALGLLTSPMMGADITRLPRNPDMRVRPGKVWLTRGRPSEVLEPVILGNIDPSSFNQSSEMERLVQVGTGAIESNAPLNADRRNETASGISMIQSSALKRQKAVMRNLETQFLNPFVRKSLWRLMQFNPNRYPADYEFCVKGTMGVVAREFEQSSLTSLLTIIPPESPAHMILLKGIIEMSGAVQRDSMLAAIAQAEQPSPEEQQRQQEQQQIQMETLREGLNEMKLENEKTRLEAEKLAAEIAEIKKRTDLMDEELDIQAMNSAAAIAKAKWDKEDKKHDRESKERIEEKKAKAAKAKPAGGSNGSR